MNTGVTINGGSDNTIGGCTVRNGGRGLALVGGYRNRILGNNVYDILYSHISITGNTADGLHNLKPTNNLISNNHFTQAYLWYTGAWKIQIDGLGTRFANNLIHDSPIQARP
jgi:parallel beta-helix repeat protein